MPRKTSRLYMSKYAEPNMMSTGTSLRQTQSHHPPDRNLSAISPIAISLMALSLNILTPLSQSLSIVFLNSQDFLTTSSELVEKAINWVRYVIKCPCSEKFVPMLHYLVFTDLDGTLLDAKTYSYEKSLAAINRLKKSDIPIIFCSAKTRAEQEIYRRELGLFHPFIVENGSAVFIPQAYFPFTFDYHKVVDDLLAIELSIPYSRVRKLLARIGDEYGFRFRGLGDMSAVEVAEITGLNLAFAKLAKQREYDEPVKLDLSGEKDASKFLTKLGEAGLNWSYGGQLYHVMGGGDKGKAVQVLSGLYRKMWGEIRTVGLGNSLNDLSMLSQVDTPILVQKRGYSWEDINLPSLRKVQGVGPEGWSRAILEVIGG